MIKVTKKHYIQGFGIIVIVLALIRCAFPNVAGKESKDETQHSTLNTQHSARLCRLPQARTLSTQHSTLNTQHSTLTTPHRINSVPNFDVAFPDSQEVQLASAQKYGVKKVMDAKDAEARKQELVYVGANPYFYIDRLKSSVPYLVPRASVLLNDIGRRFYDSLYVKGVPLHKIIITSVLRTQEEVEKLRKHNGNATENSCHMYGTTFDIAQNRYKTVENPAGPKRREVQNDTLKWILSEVLRDMRQEGRCHIKYEKKQGCFHITVR